MLEINELSTYYGSVRALDHVSLNVQHGEIVALVGANGAGKSTLLNTASGFLRPRAGQVRFENHDITTLPTETIVRRGLGLVPERRQIFSTLSVLDNLILGAYHRFKSDRKLLDQDLARMFQLFPILSARRAQMGGTLSGGD